MNPQDLNVVAGGLPSPPPEALEADSAEAGEIASASPSSVNPQSEGTDSAQVPGMGTGDDDENDVHQVWVKLQDEEENPVPNERFQIRFSDGSVQSGTTDDEGKGGFEHVPDGDCEVNFPRIHRTEWS